MNNTTLYTVLILIVIANIIASIYIAKADEYASNQKMFQIALIWLVPVFGCCFISYFLFSHRKSVGRDKLNKNNTNISKREKIEHGTAHYFDSDR